MVLDCERVRSTTSHLLMEMQELEFRNNVQLTPAQYGGPECLHRREEDTRYLRILDTAHTILSEF